MVSARLTMPFLLCCAVWFALPWGMTGCRSAEKETPPTAETPALGNAAAGETPIAAGANPAAVGEKAVAASPASTAEASTDAYREIVQAGAQIHLNYRSLPEKVGLYLQGAEPSDEEGKARWMTVAVIGAVACFWQDAREKAEDFAERAHRCTSENGISFLAPWQPHLCIAILDAKTLSRLVRAKDFVISRSNAGFQDFQMANKAFVDRGRFDQAVAFYERALSRGLEEKELRKSCYLRWACCLYRLGQEDRAEEIFLERWLLDPRVELLFGDQAMIEFIQNLRDRYLRDYPQFAQIRDAR